MEQRYGGWLKIPKFQAYLFYYLAIDDWVCPGEWLKLQALCRNALSPLPVHKMAEAIGGKLCNKEASAATEGKLGKDLNHILFWFATDTIRLNCLEKLAQNTSVSQIRARLIGISG